MRPATVAVLLLALALLIGAAVLGIGSGSDADLVERWVSDTPRDTEFNHHPIGVSPDGRVVVAPVASRGGEELTDTSCSLVRLDRQSGAVRWRATVPARKCFLHSLTGPTIGDVDGDSGYEVAGATNEEELVVYAANGGAREFVVSLNVYGYAPPTIADLQGSDRPEIVASDIEGGVVAVSGNGTVLWRRALNNTVYASPAVGDFDADGRTEVLVAGGERTALLSAAGEVEWRTNLESQTLAVGDVDEDSAIEAVVTDRRAVVAIDGRTGNTQWNATTSGVARTLAIHDGDGDGSPELYAGVYGGRVVAMDAASGDIEWSTQVVSGDEVRMPAPVVGDVNGDGTPEVIAVASDGTVVVLGASAGAELARYHRDVPIWVHPTPGDIDGDGDAEVLVRYGDGRVVALDYAS